MNKFYMTKDVCNAFLMGNVIMAIRLMNQMAINELI